MYSVALYIHAERLWQFCGEFADLSEARIVARVIRADRHGNQVRIRDTETDKRVAVGGR